MRIYGAGLAGLLAGCHFQNATIFEAQGPNQNAHKAVLRFRTSAVGDSVGIDFRKVKVHKGIWYRNEFVKPNVRVANLYSKKVIGSILDRSVWNLETAERFIAPEDFIPELIDRCGNRIEWFHDLDNEDIITANEPAISTIPMSSMAKMINQPCDFDFQYAPITVRRYKISGADVFQTVYFPDPMTNLYRASITGDLLIAEYSGPEDQYDFLPALGLTFADVTPIEKANQRYGKIAPIPDDWRKAFIFKLTSQLGIYSLGRFATWRNILLDDVLKDIAVVKKLMKTSIYERSKINAK